MSQPLSNKPPYESSPVYDDPELIAKQIRTPITFTTTPWHTLSLSAKINRINALHLHRESIEVKEKKRKMAAAKTLKGKKAPRIKKPSVLLSKTSQLFLDNLPDEFKKGLL